MSKILIKKEPVDMDDETTTKTSSSKKKRHKRPREEDNHEDQLPAIRIKKEKDLFEPPEDEDSNSSSHTAIAGGSGTRDKAVDLSEVSHFNNSIAVAANGTHTPPPPTDEPEPPPLTNFFEFSAAPIPILEQTLLEKKLQQKKLLPKPQIPKVAHYNAHDENGEKQYIADHQAKNKQHIDDHNRIVRID
jgi:hypothetical protein